MTPRTLSDNAGFSIPPVQGPSVQPEAMLVQTVTGDWILIPMDAAGVALNSEPHALGARVVEVESGWAWTHTSLRLLALMILAGGLWLTG